MGTTTALTCTVSPPKCPGHQTLYSHPQTPNPSADVRSTEPSLPSSLSALITAELMTASVEITARSAPSPGRLTPHSLILGPKIPSATADASRRRPNPLPPLSTSLNTSSAKSAQPGGRTRVAAEMAALATCPGQLTIPSSGTPLRRLADACRDSVPQKVTPIQRTGATGTTQELAMAPAIASRAGPLGEASVEQMCRSKPPQETFVRTFGSPCGSLYNGLCGADCHACLSNWVVNGPNDG